MNSGVKSLIPIVVLMTLGVVTLGVVPALAAEDAGDVSVAKDLTAVIALQSMPCGQVVSARKQAENDYIASCQDGNRYRVFVNPDGRVIVEKR